MTTANDFAQAAIQIGQMADRMTPEGSAEAHPYQQNQMLIVYHLRTAAHNAKRIAEAMAEKGKR